MSSRKFRFVSPGIFLREVDRSQLPAAQTGQGPVIIGSSVRGPSFRPTKIRSLEELENLFGAPAPGTTDDAWRQGTDLFADSYAMYAAKCYLTAGQGTDSPVTMVRLLGIAAAGASGAGSEPGWAAENAYGIFIEKADNGPGTESATAKNFELVSIFYGTDSSFDVKLTGKTANNVSAQTLRGTPMHLPATNKFTVKLEKGGTNISSEFSFDNIRDKFNTNPAQTNDEIAVPSTAALEDAYFLGETWQAPFDKLAAGISGTEEEIAVVLKLQSGAGSMSDFQSSDHAATTAKSGWFVGQREGPADELNIANHQRLFRLVALSEGLCTSKEIIISIEKIRIPSAGQEDQYGSFSVVVNMISGGTLVPVERFDDCNLDAASPNFIAKKIGDQYVEWSSEQKRNRTLNLNRNRSSYVRVDLNPDLTRFPPRSGRSTVPVGYLGPIVPSDVTVNAADRTSAAASGFVEDTMTLTGLSENGTTVKCIWPEFPLINIADENDNYKVGYSPYKLSFNASGQGTPLLNSISEDHVDFMRIMSARNSSALVNAQKAGVAAAGSKHSYLFTLEDVVLTPINGVADQTAITTVNPRGQVTAVTYTPGSCASASSFSAVAGLDKLQILFDTVGGFYAPMAGGFDGIDVREIDPFNNRKLAGGTPQTNYAYASVDRALKLIKDPEFVEYNLAAMPGITERTLTKELVTICENRADALAIIDLPNIWVPPSQKYYASESLRIQTSPKQAADDLVAQRLNSSYGATYHPWVVLRDDDNGGRMVHVPPSVPALGVMANTEKQEEVWFAPAGFSRAGLKDGAAGLPIMDTTEKLLSSDRDTLYQANINPIASFVGADGIVIFGQKTLQTTRSALDRINVRRLLIFVKKQISIISKQVLFSPNVQKTWTNFKSKVEPFLDSVQARFGLTDYKVVLDKTTTTDDLVDRNIMYAKVFLKPARAIEFIAVDFVITRSGASFVDPLE